MNKPSAVEWLALYIKGITTLNCDDIIEKAKEMEKEQSHAEYMDGWKDGLIKQGPPALPLDGKIYK